MGIEKDEISKDLLHVEKIDSLLSCLEYLTAHFGRSKSAMSITAGLAYDEKGMGPNLFCEAAENIGIKAAIAKKDNLHKINQSTFPVVLILNDNNACLLMSVSKTKARIYSAETGKIRNVDLKSLKSSYSGYVIYVHPKSGFLEGKSGSDEVIKGHWFWSLVFENKMVYINILIAAVLINIFALTSPVFVMNFYDRVIPNNAVETGLALVVGALIVFLADFIIRTLRGYFIDFSGRKIDVIAAKRIYDKLLNIRMSEKPASSGSFASMLKDFDSVRDFFTSAIVTSLIDLPFSLLFVLVIYLLAGNIAFVLLALMFVVLVVGLLVQWPLRYLVKKSVQSAEAKHGLLVETIHGIETIKAISADRRLRARYGEYAGESAYWGQRSRSVSAIASNVATMMQQSATVFIVFYGMYLVQDGDLTMGALIASVILGGRALAPIGQVAGLMTRYHHAASSLKTLNNIMKKPVERPEGVKFLHRPDLSGKISFDKVNFSYPSSNRKVLDNVSFVINSGEKIGIIGRVGSGKSTIAKMIMGLYQPADGHILADDTDYSQIDPADIRRNTSYISQDVVLLRGTIKESITASNPTATEEEIINAAKKSGVHDFVSRHPEGYDMQVGEGGLSLSGGQRQAVALARAMLLNPNIMVCDEPTNAMDIQAEEAFVKYIKEEVKDNTLILITHRPSLLPLVDRLILVDNGKILLDGKRDDVIKALNAGEIKVDDN